jgi:hypothetical protein
MDCCVVYIGRDSLLGDNLPIFFSMIAGFLVVLVGTEQRMVSFVAVCKLWDNPVGWTESC